jgi:dihydroxyacetone kinase
MPCQASVTARAAADSTVSLLPKKGRARPHAEKSLGTPDAGAVSLALITAAAQTALAADAGQLSVHREEASR